MTLVLNEIHWVDGLNRSVMVAAADRRISRPDGSHYGDHPKLFRIPYLNGAISYFGLAEFRDSAGVTHRLWDWLPAFIRHQHDAPDLRTFASRLRDGLHTLIPPTVLGSQPSGFHICGHNADLLPEHWLLTNIRQMAGPHPTELQPTYKAPAEHFLGRDAREKGWDGKGLRSICERGGRIYRNGDFRGHAIAADLLDKIMDAVFELPDFRRPATPAEYRKYVHFKFKFIASLYKNWATHQIVAEPIDVFVWSADVGRRKLTAHWR